MKRLNRTLYVVWLVVLATTLIAQGGSASVSRSALAATWPASQAINPTGTGGQYSPAIAVDSTGNVYVAWEDYRNGNADIYFSQWSPGTVSWVTPVKLNDDGGASEQIRPSVAVGGNYIYVAWEDWRNGDTDIYSTRRLISGGAWEANKRVNQDRGDGDTPNTDDQKWPRLCMDASGMAHAVWQDKRSDYKKTYYGWRAPSDSEWSLSYKVTSAEGAPDYEQLFPNLACRGSGSGLLLYAIWQDTRRGNADIYYSYANYDSAWAWYPEDGKKVNEFTGDTYQTRPSIALTPSNVAWAVWLDDHTGSAQVFASYRLSDGNWYAPNWQVSSAGAWNMEDGNPRIAVAPNTGWPHVVWLDAGGNVAYSYWNGGGWVAQAPVSDSNTGTHSSPEIATNASGNLYVVWSDGRGGGNPHIYFATTTPFKVDNESLFKAWPGGVQNHGRFYLDLTVHNSEPFSRMITTTVQLPSDFYFYPPSLTSAMSEQSSSGIIQVTAHTMTWTQQIDGIGRFQLPSWTIYVSTALTLPTVLNSTAVITDNVQNSSNNKIIQAPMIVNPLQVYMPIVFKK